MHLKSITVKGFKSFPDRTRLEFGPGVSVIVGPNGSGKSNITDAVLWALGEQSPLAVRGQSMQDVIFGGARGQQARRSAEVELVIDNGDGGADVELSEISIMRRLDRNGEGEYRLNGARCRLVDVLEVLSDTGLGKEMHSVVSQGRVEGVVTSKPRDRRLLIEEAAGLGKHRKRRRRAQLKLARTQDNLDRALDVEREARSRLRPLKRQAEAAELHERLERQTTEARWELARDDARARREALAAAESAAAQARAVRDELDAALAAVASRREAAEEALAQRGEERERLARSAFAARAAQERVAMRSEQARATAGTVTDRAGQAEARIAALEADMPGAARDAGVARRLESELAELERMRESELTEQVAGLERRREEAVADVQRCDADVQAARAALAAADETCEAARAARREADTAVDRARREAARVGADLAAVNHFLGTRAGAPGGATALADEVDVEAGYELALAAALAGRLSAAVVGDADAAGRLLDGAGADGGTALVTGSARTQSSTGPPTVGARPLADLLRGSGASLQLARGLLADAWVVETVAAVEPGFAGIAVTRSGRAWFGRWHELRQAPAGGEERVLEQRNRRETLLAQTEDAAQAERAAAGRVAEAGDAVAKADEAREQTDARLRAALRARDQGAEEQRRAEWAIEQRRAAPDEGPGALRRAQLQAELDAERRLAQEAERLLGEHAERLEAQRAALARDRALSPLAGRLTAALEALDGALTQRAVGCETRLQDDRSAGEGLASELRGLAHEEAQLQARLRECAETVTGVEVAAQQARDGAAEVGAELERLAARLELDAEPAREPLPEAERAALSQRVERLGRRREQIGPVNPLAKDEYAEAVAHVEELETQRRDLETALRELGSLISETDRRIREAFEQTFDATARNFEVLVEQLFPGGRGRLRLVLDDAGPRPVLGGQEAASDAGSRDAGEEAAEAEERGDPGQEEDLLGVEIEMTPAGKSMKRLSLLSGGEKSLTALAFLFAIFLARPCPFYVLDEVEAALDDLNIDRFLTLLRRHAGRSQFIVVTHQKRTMEAADTLYGVSMGDDGVSKVISRRLPRDEPAGAVA